MKNIVLFGPPGAGKGTQAGFLRDYFDLIHISTGEIFRENIKRGTDLGKLAKRYIDHGNLVPDKVTIEILKEEVEKYPDAKGFIFDGFPRTPLQAKALDIYLAGKNTGVTGMIALEVPEKLLVERVLLRGKTSDRPDDYNEELIRHRFEEYYKKTEIVKGYYQKQNKYFGINGVGSIEDISSRILAVLE